MKIRPASINDQPRILELLVELRATGYREMGKEFNKEPITENTKSLFSDLLNNSNTCILVAESDRNIVGVLVAYMIPKILDGYYRMLIEELVIDSDYRGQGIGGALLKEIEAIAASKNIMYVKVTTGTKLRANSFYLKSGYMLFENCYRKKVL